MIQKKLMAVIRGKATPLQVFLACVAGAVLGFLPPPLAAPGLSLAALSLLFILNANLFIATAVFAAAKLLTILGEPLVFELGLFLIESPLRPLFAAAANTPVLALMGLDSYSAVGGLVVGLLAGSALGVAAGWALIQSRKALALLEKQTETEGSAARKILKHPLVKVVTLVCLGGLDAKGNATYADLARKKFGLPVRPLGIVALLLLIALTTAAGHAAREGLFTSLITAQLEQANGATVDLDQATVDLAAGTVTLTNLALADPADLAKNTLEAGTVQIDIATADLLTKRVEFDRVELTAARHATTRPTPGRLVAPLQTLEADLDAKFDNDLVTDEPAGQDAAAPDGMSEQRAERLDRLLTDANALKDRVKQLYRFVDRLSGTPGVERDDAGNTTIDTASLKDAKRLEAKLKGYYRVTADHLLQDAPRLIIREIVAGDITSDEAPGDSFDARAENLSTDPTLLGAPASFSLSSASGRIEADLTGLGGGAVPDLDITLKDINTSDLFAVLSDTVRSNLQITGGTADLTIDATLPSGRLDTDLTVTLRNIDLKLPDLAGQGGATIDELPIAITARGPIDAPRITVDDEALKEAVANALGHKAFERATEELDKLANDKLPDDVKDKLDQIIDEDTKDKARSTLRNLFGNNDDDG